MLERFKEPSTYAGIASVVAGVGQIFGDVNTPIIAQSIQDAAPHFASGNWKVGIIAAISGMFAIFMREGNK